MVYYLTRKAHGGVGVRENRHHRFGGVYAAPLRDHKKQTMSKQHGKEVSHAAIISVVTDHFGDYQEPRETTFLMRSLFGMAIESSSFELCDAAERSRLYDHMEGLCNLIERLDSAMAN
jgi:hypothetical protein